MWNLKPSKDVIDLCSDSEKDIEQKSAGESLQDEAVESEAVTEPESENVVPVKRVKKEKIEKSNSHKSEGRGKFIYQEKWGPHQGHGRCRGLGYGCVMGERGGPAFAGPSGYCDLCNIADLPLLHQHGQGRLTHLLLELTSAQCDLALSRIEEQDKTMAAECRARLQRARHRRRPDRPRRGPRGPYKKK